MILGEWGFVVALGDDNVNQNLIDDWGNGFSLILELDCIH